MGQYSQGLLKRIAEARTAGRPIESVRCTPLMVRYRGEEFAVRVCYSPEQAQAAQDAYPDGVIDIEQMLQGPRTSASRNDRMQVLRYVRDAYHARAKDRADLVERMRATAAHTLMLNEARAAASNVNR